MPATLRKQIEGSQAMAEAIARCRPEVVCAYPITPQTHIVEAVSRIARAGRLGTCEVINVESEFAALSCLDRRQRRRCAHLHRDREPGAALHVRSALQCLRAGPPDRDDRRQPRARRADQHLERPVRLDGDARQRLAADLRDRQPGGRRPPHPGVQDRGGALAADHGVRRRIRPHARAGTRRGTRSGGRRCIPAAVRTAPGARPGRPIHDRRDGRPRCFHRGALPAARPAARGARGHPARRRGVRGPVRAPRRRPRRALPQRRRGDHRARARLGQRDPAGGRRRAARAGRRGRVGRTQVLPAVPVRRGARRARPREARDRARAGACTRDRRDRRRRRRARASRPRDPDAHGDRRPRRTPGHAALAARDARRRPRRAALPRPADRRDREELAR